MLAQGQNKPHNFSVQLLIFSLTVPLLKNIKMYKKVKYPKQLQQYFEGKKKKKEEIPECTREKKKLHRGISFLITTNILPLYSLKTPVSKFRNQGKLGMVE